MKTLREQLEEAAKEYADRKEYDGMYHEKHGSFLAGALLGARMGFEAGRERRIEIVTRTVQVGETEWGEAIPGQVQEQEDYGPIYPTLDDFLSNLGLGGEEGGEK